jgi:hypothetical protein
VGVLIPYGPDDTLATKLVASVMSGPRNDVIAMKRWTTADGDVRQDRAISTEVADFFTTLGVGQTTMADRIMGCPHEEGIDYPMGRTCPKCPFWAQVDRLTHERIERPVATMTAAEVLESLAGDEHDRIDDALVSADALADALLQPLLDAVEVGIRAPADATQQQANLFSYALYILARWREPRGYDAVVRWLSLPAEQPFEIAGDIVTQDGGRILASVFSGDMAPIKALILNREANEYGRAAGVRALALLAVWAEVPRQSILDTMAWLVSEAGMEREPNAAWDDVASSCVDIEASEMLPHLRRAYDEGLIDPRFISREELEEAATADGSNIEYMRDRWPPIDDVADATAWWDREDAHTGDDVAGDDGGHLEVQQPFRAPPKVGRNEPCPCGSGKKFKKCCGK